MNNIKKILGPLFPILMIASTILMVFSLSRLGLALWHLDRVSAVDGWFNIFMSGLRIDIASVCFLLVLPALISSLISAEHRIGQIWNFLLRVWITFGLWFAVYMEVVTPAFIIEYDLRPNRLFIEYLIYPKEVFGMLWSAYKLELAIGLFATIITVFYGWKLSRIVCTNLHYPKWYWRPAIMLLVVLVGTMGARSTLGHRPLNPAMVAFASDPLINDLTLNSSYSVLFAAKQMKSEASAYDYYPKLDDKLVISEIKASMNVLEKDFISADKPTLANHQSQYQGAPKNIVILLLESHGARYVKSLGGIDLSPNLDKLIGEGWAFKRMYASGTRSVRGIEAVTTGFSPTPARAVVKLGKSQTNFFSVARLLKSNQYHTQFIYGGESHFDNMKSFFLGNGFDDMQDFPTFKAPKFVGSWGASDEDLLNKADRQFQQLTEQKKLFFSLVFTSSNHSPFEYPDNTIEQYNEPKQTVENAVKYADYALGKFVAQAKASPYWDNTVFAVIADHDSRTYGASPLPIGHFKIPAVIFGGGIAPRIDNRLVSQIDLAPTLLSLAGIDSKNPMVGHDLTQRVPIEKQRALMQRGKNFGWMTADNKVVVLQPGQGISTYNYDPLKDTMTAAKVDDAIIQRAHANAMWGSLAFKKDYYTAQQDYQVLVPQEK